MKKKNVTAVSFDDLKKIVLNDAKNGDGILTQDEYDEIKKQLLNK